MVLNSVVLPAPLGPIRPTMVPSGTVKETESSATMPPKRTLTSRTSSKPPISAQVYKRTSGWLLGRRLGRLGLLGRLQLGRERRWRRGRGGWRSHRTDFRTGAPVDDGRGRQDGRAVPAHQHPVGEGRQQPEQRDDRQEDERRP